MRMLCYSMTFQKHSQKAFEIYELSRTALSFALHIVEGGAQGLQFGCANGASTWGKWVYSTRVK